MQPRKERSGGMFTLSKTATGGQCFLFSCLLSCWLCSFILFCYITSENRHTIISSSPERQIFWFSVLLNTCCITFVAEFALMCFFLLLLSILSLPPRENEVFYDVVAIVDPLTREAQKMSSLLMVSCILPPLLLLFSASIPNKARIP